MIERKKMRESYTVSCDEGFDVHVYVYVYVYVGDYFTASSPCVIPECGGILLENGSALGLNGFVPQHPLAGSIRNSGEMGSLGNDWAIGRALKPGVPIGSGSRKAAENVPSHTAGAGNPARVIRRFGKEEAP